MRRAGARTYSCVGATSEASLQERRVSAACTVFGAKGLRTSLVTAAASAASELECLRLLAQRRQGVEDWPLRMSSVAEAARESGMPYRCQEETGS
jgi:hypothetical protein